MAATSGSKDITKKVTYMPTLPGEKKHHHRPEQTRGMLLLLVLHSIRTRSILSFFHECCDRHRVNSFANERVGEDFMPAEF